MLLLLHQDLYALLVFWLLPLFKLSLVAFNAAIFVYVLFLLQRHRLNAHSIHKLMSAVDMNHAHSSGSSDDDDDDNDLRVGFVVAHPDDEAMFMVPTVCGMHLSESQQRSVVSDTEGDEVVGEEGVVEERGIRIHILCLSSGNADGLGNVRIAEWRQCLMHMGIISQDRQLQVVTTVMAGGDVGNDARAILVDNEEEFADGMKEQWDVNRISQYVESFVRLYRLRALFTFDAWGISRHPNHTAVHFGVKKFLKENRQGLNGAENAVIGYELETVSMWRKYSAVIDAVLPGSKTRHESDQHLSFVVPSNKTFDAYSAMKCHGSQFVWFRRLFVFFSRYAYYNTWKRIHHHQAPSVDSGKCNKNLNKED